jgi:hypothetical protein
MEGESDRAFAECCAYRDLGPERSLAKLQAVHPEEEGWGRTAIGEAAERWRWSTCGYSTRPRSLTTNWI